MVQTDDLDKKTVAQLKEIAKGMGLTGLSKMKKADLIAAIQEKISEPEASAPEPAPEPEPEASEPAPEPEPEPEVAKEVPVEAESTPVEEEVAKEAPEPEEVAAEAPEPAPEPEAAEEPPVEPVEAEPAPDPEPAPEPAPEEAVAEAPAQSPKAEKPKVVEKPPTKLQLKIRGKYDIAALKTEKKTLKGQIADAIESRDSAKVKELRKRKKEIRRILKKAS